MSVFIIECAQPLFLEKGQRPDDVFLEAYNRALTRKEIWNTKEVKKDPIEIILSEDAYIYEVKKDGADALVTMLPLRRGARSVIAVKNKPREVKGKQTIQLNADKRGKRRFYLMQQDNQQRVYIHGVIHCSSL